MLKKLKKFLSQKKTFSLLLEVVGIILIWRGVWGFFDLYFFSNHPIISYFLSILVGLLLIWIDDQKLDELE